MKAFYTKHEICKAAEMSRRSFTRFLASRRKILTEMGCSIRARTLSRACTAYICSELGVPLEEV